MKNKHVQIVDQFTPTAHRLRSHYDLQFKNPLEGTSNRFVWDYWHVPDQYTLVRTPAATYFPKNIFSKFISELTHWGQTNLGCSDISPPWLSYYVEGCEQKLHCDIPHGPWAFVYSLSIPKHFIGGETLILRPEHLNYWSRFSSTRGLEQEDLIYRISPRFNRLIVFDPRIPHGVTQLKGTHDPRFARLVIHGWFTQPKPIIIGPLSSREVQDQITQLVTELQESLNQISPVTGTQSYKLHVSAQGTIAKVEILTNTLVSREGQAAHVRALSKWLHIRLKSIKFKKHKTSSLITLPLIFE